MSGERILVLILIVNAILALLYFLIACLIIVPFTHRDADVEDPERDNRRSYFTRFLIMLLCPIVGIVYFLLSHILNLIFFHKQATLEDVIFGKERVENRAKADEETERNIVPLEEGLAVSDRKKLRTLMMSIVKEDARQSLAVIYKALDNSDSETAHYAASVLQEILDDFRLNVYKISTLIEELREKAEEQDARLAEMEEVQEAKEAREAKDIRESKELEVAREETRKALIDAELHLLDYMDPVLCQRVFQEMEQNRFVDLMDTTADALYEEDTASLSRGQYEEICRRLVEQKKFERAEVWCSRMEDVYPEQLETYRTRLRLTFESGRYEDFLETVARLKRSDVVIDAQTLELIRILQPRRNSSASG